MVREVLFVEVGKRHQMQLQGLGVRQGLAGWSDLSDASRQDLQATLKKLQAAKQNAAAAPQAVSALEERIQQVKDAIYRCEPSPCPDLQASDGHWKGRGHCEEPQGAIVAVVKRHSRKRKTICGSSSADSTK